MGLQFVANKKQTIYYYSPAAEPSFFVYLYIILHFKTVFPTNFMKPFFRVRLLKRTTVSLMQTAGLVIFILYVIIPLIFRFSPLLQRHMIFLPYLRWPTGVNFSETELHGLNATRNFYIETEADVRVGVWHMLPISLVNESYTHEEYEKSLSEGFPIIMHLHGNSGSRISVHRMELYKIL